jgi:hypothetical protein
LQQGPSRQVPWSPIARQRQATAQNAHGAQAIATTESIIERALGVALPAVFWSCAAYSMAAGSGSSSRGSLPDSCDADGCDMGKPGYRYFLRTLEGFVIVSWK